MKTLGNAESARTRGGKNHGKKNTSACVVVMARHSSGPQGEFLQKDTSPCLEDLQQQCTFCCNIN